MRATRLANLFPRRPASLLSIQANSRPHLPTTTTIPLKTATATTYLPTTQISPFHTTSPLPKKKSSNNSKHAKPTTPTPDEDLESDPYGDEADQTGDEDLNGPKLKHPPANPEEPTSFADVDSRFTHITTRFNDLVRKIRSGQTTMAITDIGAVRVRPAKDNPETFPLREIASVVSRGGRMVGILAHDLTYIKPIMSAIQSSPEFNQQPQRSPDNELELTMKVQRESQEQMVKRVKEAAHQSKEGVRMVRQKRDKLQGLWVKEGLWVPDMRFKAGKELQKKVEKKNLEIDKAEAAALKSIASMREE